MITLRKEIKTMSRYNMNSKQPDHGELLTIKCDVVEKANEMFVVIKYYNTKGKLIRLETETARF